MTSPSPLLRSDSGANTSSMMQTLQKLRHPPHGIAAFHFEKRVLVTGGLPKERSLSFRSERKRKVAHGWTTLPSSHKSLAQRTFQLRANFKQSRLFSTEKLKVKPKLVDESLMQTPRGANIPPSITPTVCALLHFFLPASRIVLVRAVRVLCPSRLYFLLSFPQINRHSCRGGSEHAFSVISTCT